MATNGGKLVQTGIQFPDNTIQTTAGVLSGSVGWNWSGDNVDIARIGLGGTDIPVGWYQLSDNTMGLYLWAEVWGGANTGDYWAIDMYDVNMTFSGQAFLTGTNMWAGPDGGSGMQDGSGTFVPVGQNIKYIKAYQVNGRNRQGRVLLQGRVASLPDKWATYSSPTPLFTTSADNINVFFHATGGGQYATLSFLSTGIISCPVLGQPDINTYSGPTRWIAGTPASNKQYELRIKIGTSYSTGNGTVGWYFTMPAKAGSPTTAFDVQGQNMNSYLDQFSEWRTLGNGYLNTGTIHTIWLAAYPTGYQQLNGTVYIREVGTTTAFAKNFKIEVSADYPSD
jgi:hypothetical protein